MLGVTDVEALKKRTRHEFLLPAVDDQLHLRIGAACNLLVSVGLAKSMPYLRKRDKLVETKDRAAALRAELGKKNPQVFVSASANRHVGVDSTFLRGLPDTWSRLVFFLEIHCRPLPLPLPLPDQERLLVEAGDILHALTGFAIPHGTGRGWSGANARHWRQGSPGVISVSKHPDPNTGGSVGCARRRVVDGICQRPVSFSPLPAQRARRKPMA